MDYVIPLTLALSYSRSHIVIALLYILVIYHQDATTFGKSMKDLFRNYLDHLLGNLRPPSIALMTYSEYVIPRHV